MFSHHYSRPSLSFLWFPLHVTADPSVHPIRQKATKRHRAEFDHGGGGIHWRPTGNPSGSRLFLRMATKPLGGSIKSNFIVAGANGL
jgi:hypothetical protein